MPSTDVQPIPDIMRPLEDLRIIAVEQFGAGPFGSMQLADLGAEVIKIEDARTGGDVSRYIPPFQQQEDSLFFETFNRNKRSLSLDLSTDAGQNVLHDLVEVSDVVYANLRGDVAAHLGLTYERLSHIKQDIVCVNISAFGADGPMASRPGYDYIIQALTGWMELAGEPDQPPAKTGLSVVDYCSGLVGAISLLAAVHQARRDGVGANCDISLYDVAISMLTYPGTWHLNEGWTPERLERSAHPSIVPFQLFRGSDSEWFLIACAKEVFWTRLAEVLEQPELATDQRFSSFEARQANRVELIAILDELFNGRTTAEWIGALEAVAVPCAPILDVPTALRHPLIEQRSLVVETQHPRFGTVKQVRSAVRVGSDADTEYRRAPLRNEDAPQILGSLLGYSDDHVARLTAQGAFGEPS